MESSGSAWSNMEWAPVRGGHKGVKKQGKKGEEEEDRGEENRVRLKILFDDFTPNMVEFGKKILLELVSSTRFFNSFPSS